jgi:hypothetical protein
MTTYTSNAIFRASILSRTVIVRKLRERTSSNASMPKSKRRTDVVGIFPNDGAAGLIGALLLEHKRRPLIAAHQQSTSICWGSILSLYRVARGGLWPLRDPAGEHP